MAHSLTTTMPICTTISKKTTRQVAAAASSLRFQKLWACQGRRQRDSSTRLADSNTELVLLHRRTLALGLSGALLGLNIDNGGSTANAAARRPPAPPPKEKTDPNVSGVQAKVLASKKRKEAMKEAISKLRERGKAIDNKPTIQTPATSEATE